MSAVMLPTTVSQLLPTLQALNAEQKLHIIRELLTDTMPRISNKEIKKEDSPNENLAWEMGKDIFGSYHSGQGNLSTNTKKIVKQQIRQKYGKNSD